MICNTPSPPYYAVIFTTMQSDQTEGYSEMADKLDALVEGQDGFLGQESLKGSFGLTVSYWKDLASIAKWKNNDIHIEAQNLGKSGWYEKYKTRIAYVERDYEFSAIK